jgi:hypothetical protein
MELVRILKGRVNSGFWRSAGWPLFLVGSHQFPIGAELVLTPDDWRMGVMPGGASVGGQGAGTGIWSASSHRLTGVGLLLIFLA